MKDRVLGVVMILFAIAGGMANGLYGAGLPPWARSVVGTLSGAGLFWILISFHLRRQGKSPPE